MGNMQQWEKDAADKMLPCRNKKLARKRIKVIKKRIKEHNKKLRELIEELIYRATP